MTDEQIAMICATYLASCGEVSSNYKFYFKSMLTLIKRGEYDKYQETAINA